MNFTKYIVLALSVFFAHILIFNAFADDDHYRKRHRNRWGSQVPGGHNGDDDIDDRIRPVGNRIYKETCGECHFAYQPELLPSASWLKILDRRQDHFGEQVDIDPDVVDEIVTYLKSNGAESSSAELPEEILRSLGSRVPARITDIPYIRRKHRDIAPAVFKRETIGSMANCSACHKSAEMGIYEDDNVRIPR
jgi:mono/diheme cytochrome c family protein